MESLNTLHKVSLSALESVLTKILQQCLPDEPEIKPEHAARLTLGVNDFDLDETVYYVAFDGMHIGKIIMGMDLKTYTYSVTFKPLPK